MHTVADDLFNSAKVVERSITADQLVAALLISAGAKSATVAPVRKRREETPQWREWRVAAVRARDRSAGGHCR